MNRTAVYRHYDADGRLLYVGACGDVGSRTARHMREAKWAPMSVRAEATFYPTREEALDAELAAIKAENPIHNVVRDKRSLSKPPSRPKRVPVGDDASEFRSAFPSIWGQYLRERYRTAYAVQRAFPDIDMKTARDWIGGKRDPSGNFVIRAVAMDETALEILGAIA